MKNNYQIQEVRYPRLDTYRKALTSKFDRKLFQLLTICFLSVFLQVLCMTTAFAYDNEVRALGNSYVYRVGGVDVDTVDDLTTAINNTLWGSKGLGREIHVLTGGDLSGTISIPGYVKAFFHNNTFTTTHSGLAVKGRAANIHVYDMNLNASRNFYVFRFSGCNNAILSGININGGGIGMRLESSTSSEPWKYTFYNLTVTNCSFKNLGSHGLETYSVDTFNITGITARNTGGCGVLLNNSRNGSIGTVDSYKSCYLGGYAGLRFANSCFNITTESLIARECGRGLFVTSGSYDIHVKKAIVIDCVDQWGTGRGIWFEATPDCSVESGCCNSGIRNTGPRSYAKVSTTCEDEATTTYYKIQNRATGLVLDGMGRTKQGSVVGQYDSDTTHHNAQWQRIDFGSYVQFKNRGTRMVLDGGGLTDNGSTLQQYGINANHNQQWSLLPTDKGYFRLQNRGTAMFIDGMGRTTNGSDAGQGDSTTTHPNAQWILVSVGSGSVAQSAQESVSGVVYPNPTAKEITISLPDGNDGESRVTLSDGLGKVVTSNTFSGSKHTMYMGNLPAGTYILKIQNPKKLIVEKVIKR